MIPELIRVIRNLYPTILAQNIVDVQPMNLHALEPGISLSAVNPLIAHIPFRIFDSNEFVDWCKSNNIVLENYNAIIPDDETKVLFKLRWGTWIR